MLVSSWNQREVIEYGSGLLWSELHQLTRGTLTGTSDSRRHHVSQNRDPALGLLRRDALRQLLESVGHLCRCHLSHGVEDAKRNSEKKGPHSRKDCCVAARKGSQRRFACLRLTERQRVAWRHFLAQAFATWSIIPSDWPIWSRSSHTWLTVWSCVLILSTSCFLWFDYSLPLFSFFFFFFFFFF